MEENRNNLSARRQVFLRAAGAMFGLIIALALVVGFVVWWQSRPKPWDTESVTATFDSVDTEGTQNTLLFFYTVENRTDRDYKVEGANGATIAVRLKEQGSLALDATGKLVTVEFPLFIPAHEKILYRIHVGGPYKSEKSLPTGDEKKARHAAVAAFVADELKNLDGFVLLDQTLHYKVVFPKGW
jgi:hypothetical protein